MEWWPILGGWTILEIGFYLLFRYRYIERANQRNPNPAEYREPFRNQRCLLLERILHRILQDANCELGSHASHVILAEFLLAWFVRTPDDVDGSDVMVTKDKASASSEPIRQIPSRLPSSTCYSDDETSEEEDEPAVSVVVQYLDDDTWTVPGMSTQQLRSFFAWAFFAADEGNLNDTELAELHSCMEYLQNVIRVQGDDDSPPLYTPRRLTLEDVNPWHRAFLVYVAVYVMRCIAAVILRTAGFRFVQSDTGVRAWVRTSHETTTPLVFFHGIAPGAILLYLPMVLFGMRAQNCLLIENPNISCCIQFDALSESETVEGVEQLVKDQFGAHTPVVLAGHSFGSCPISWILNHNKGTKSLPVADILLLDPVTILLSESDVMINFLYAHDKVVDKIRMVASSELFTEYYLRRHFAWYNSELWLDEHTEQNICLILAEQDEIVNAYKVQRHAERHDHVETTVWEAVGHGSIVVDYTKWGVLQRRLSQSGVVQQ